MTLSCNYSGIVYNLQWYRQYVGSRPEFLILVNENSEASEPSLRLSAKDSKKQVNLTMSSAEVTDSAVYYCALRPTVTESPETLYKTLRSVRLRFFVVSVTDFILLFNTSMNNPTILFQLYNKL